MFFRILDSCVGLGQESVSFKRFERDSPCILLRLCFENVQLALPKLFSLV